MPHIIEGTARNYRLNDSLSNPLNEWPNRYCYLIYEIFSALRSWITDADELPPTQANIALKRVDSQHDNGNIPKSSVRALSECLYAVLVSENIQDKQKMSFVELVFGVYFDLRESDNLQDYAEVLLICLRDTASYKTNNDLYFQYLRNCFENEETEYLIKHNESDVGYLREFIETL